MKKFLIAGNWKMNNTLNMSEELFSAINIAVSNINENDLANIEIVVCPNFVNIYHIVLKASGIPVYVGAQNCYTEIKGAFTGEISATMLKSVGCKYCIVGHSERRTIFKESNEFINKKVKVLIENDINPILCIGETIEERKSSNTFSVLKSQLDNCLKDISTDDLPKIVIAYEPVWAIGTGISATTKEIAEAHNWLRHYLIANYGEIIANKIYILYGGSLTENNADETFSIENVNGGLIGGASLVADKFLSIIHTAIAKSKENDL